MDILDDVRKQLDAPCVPLKVVALRRSDDYVVLPIVCAHDPCV